MNYLWRSWSETLRKSMTSTPGKDGGEFCTWPYSEKRNAAIPISTVIVSRTNGRRDGA